MNVDLRFLLKRTPGVICVASGIICRKIDFENWVAMLTMHDSMELLEVGNWVQVRSGSYKRDGVRREVGSVSLGLV